MQLLKSAWDAADIIDVLLPTLRQEQPHNCPRSATKKNITGFVSHSKGHYHLTTRRHKRFDTETIMASQPVFLSTLFNRRRGLTRNELSGNSEQLQLSSNP